MYNDSENTVVAYLNAKSEEWITPLTEEIDIAITSDHWRIGRDGDWFGLMKVDDLILWDRPLSSDQIKTIYDNHDGKCIALSDCLHQ